MTTLTTYILLSVFIVLAVWLAVAIKKSNLTDPLDLVTSPVSGRLSAAKVGQLVGMIVATWVVVSLTATEKLTFDLFGVYLLYIGGVDAYSKFLRKDPPAGKMTKMTKTEITNEPHKDPE